MTININSKNIYRLFQSATLLVILFLLVWSRPWAQSTTTDKRTIKVSGNSVIKATPDQFVFSPYFEKTGTNREALLKELSEESNQVVKQLQEIGVSEEDIKLNADSYDNSYWSNGDEGRLTAQLTITVKDKDLAQKVQDYLLTTGAKGQLTPRADFSEDKKDQLDARAIKEATEEAKQKAEAQLQLLGAKLGKVISVSQGSDSIFIDYPEPSLGYEVAQDEKASKSSLPVLSGKNEYRQTVTIVYEIR